MFVFFILAAARRARTPKKPKPNYNLECINFIKHLEREIKWDPSTKELITSANYYCESVDDDRAKSVCKQFIEENQFTDIIDKIKNGTFSALAICSTMNYTRPFGNGRIVPVDLCTQIIDSLKKDFKEQNPNYVYHNEDEQPHDIREEIQRRFQEKNNPNSASKINSYSSVRVCKDFNDTEKLLCQVISRIAFRKTLKEIKKGEESISICKKLEDLKQLTLYHDET